MGIFGGNTVEKKLQKLEGKLKEVEDDNLQREMEGVEQTVEEAGTVTAGEIP